jgi:hypothetical protein
MQLTVITVSSSVSCMQGILYITVDTYPMQIVTYSSRMDASSFVAYYKWQERCAF